jgi:hypothetical protein
MTGQPLFEPADLPFYATVLWVTTGVFALGAVLTSVLLIGQHLSEFRAPPVQRKIIGILWLVPLYAVTSWLSLRYLHAALYLDIVRDSYEAFVLYLFLMYLVTLITEDGQAKDDKEQVEEMARFLKAQGKDEKWLPDSKRGVLQYLAIKPAATLVAIGCEASGIGQVYEWMKPLLVTGVTVSGCVALYFLLDFYLAVKDRLANHSIGGKFLSVKSVIFLTFYQGVGLQVAQWYGVLHKIRFAYVQIRPYSSETISREVQDALICLEMFFISVVHWWTFPVTPFRSDERSHVTPEFGDVMGYRDTYRDLRLLYNLDAGLKTAMGLDKSLVVEMPNTALEMPPGYAVDSQDSDYHLMHPTPEKVPQLGNSAPTNLEFLMTFQAFKAFCVLLFPAPGAVQSKFQRLGIRT